MYSRLSFSAWNINGLKHNIIGNKLTNGDFIQNIKDHDLIFLTETWSKETNSIPGFNAISTITATPRSNRSCRLSGGISVLFKKELETFLSIEKQTKNFLWCRIDRTILNQTKDLFVCGVYIPPEMSPYFDDEIFEELENDILNPPKKET
jgi:exonuclease III